MLKKTFKIKIRLKPDENKSYFEHIDILVTSTIPSIISTHEVKKAVFDLTKEVDTSFK